MNCLNIEENVVGDWICIAENKVSSDVITADGEGMICPYSLLKT